MEGTDAKENWANPDRYLYLRLARSKGGRVYEIACE